MDISVTLANLLAVCLLVFMNGFFTAAGFAIVRIRATQIAPLSRLGNKRAKTAQHVITHLDSYLAATQLGNTLTSLGIGWIGEPFFSRLLSPLWVWMGVTQPGVVATISFLVGFSIVSFLNIVFGELAPKSLAIQKTQSVTLAVAQPLHLFYKVFRPVIRALNGTAGYILKLVGIKPASEADLTHSEEELRLLLSSGKTISNTSRSILLKAMELRDRTVREVMVPRTGIIFLSTEKTIQENIAIVMESQFTRYPLCDTDLDNILGMIHLKDVIRLKPEHGGVGQLLSIKREMMFVPETMPLERILTAFLTKRVLMAVAVDEYGGTAGLVTLENVLEELVGEIRDEFDVEPQMVQKVNETEYLVDGSMPLHDFARMFEIVPTSKDFVSLSGYVIHLIGRVPEKGAHFPIGTWDAVIEIMEKKKVKQVRLRRSRRTEGAEQT